MYKSTFLFLYNVYSITVCQENHNILAFWNLWARSSIQRQNTIYQWYLLQCDAFIYRDRFLLTVTAKGRNMYFLMVRHCIMCELYIRGQVLYFLKQKASNQFIVTKEVESMLSAVEKLFQYLVLFNTQLSPKLHFISASHFDKMTLIA